MVTVNKIKKTIDEVEVRPVNLAKLQYYLGYHIRQAQVAVFRDLSHSTDGIALTPGEFSLLTIVRANPGISQVTLAKLYELDKSTLSHSVKVLVNRGCIIRRRIKEDRRYFGLKLTVGGSRLLDQYTEVIEAQERLMEDVLGANDHNRLRELLMRVSKALS